jgi:hypothetical protein
LRRGRRQTAASIVLPIGFASGALGQEDLPPQHSLLPQQNVRVMVTRAVGVERNTGTRRGCRSMMIDRLRCIRSLKAGHGRRGLVVLVCLQPKVWSLLSRRRHTVPSTAYSLFVASTYRPLLSYAFATPTIASFPGMYAPQTVHRHVPNRFGSSQKFVHFFFDGIHAPAVVVGRFACDVKARLGISSLIHSSSGPWHKASTKIVATASSLATVLEVLYSRE